MPSTHHALFGSEAEVAVLEGLGEVAEAAMVVGHRGRCADTGACTKVAAWRKIPS